MEETDFNLAQLIDELFVVFELRFEQKGIDFRLEWHTVETEFFPKTRFLTHSEQEGRPIFVYGDEGKLRRVLMNLLVNAVKFTETGEVILRISQSSSSEITPTVWEGRPEVNYFTFEVIDTGVGIPLDKQAKIFEPFTQSESRTEDLSNTENEGIGLGLAISKRYVEIMEGELAVESPPQVGVEVRRSNGSRFFFTVPLQMATDEIASRAMDSSKGDSNIPSSLANGVKVKALVADDNQENLNVLSRMLEDIGVTVIIAENGEHALEIVRNERPDIVFMDIWMPVMDGLEATEQILKEFKEERPKLVAVSASALIHERQAYFEAGFDDFIAKPVNAQQIYDCLANILRIEYEYEDTKTSQIELEKIVLPEDLLLRLKKAAEFREVTEIRELLGEVRQIEHGNLLAEQLLKLTWDLDMDAILEILEAIHSC